MRKQRNNIASLEFEHRQVISRLVFDGLGYGAIRQRLLDMGVRVKLHNSSLLAWQKSAEYREYCEARKGFDARSKANRLAALVQNDGRGPQSLADVAEYEILVQLTQLASGGLLETGKDVATVANAIAALQRTQLARAAAGRDTEITKLKDQHAADLAELSQQLEAKDAEIQRMRDETDAKLAQLSSGRQITPAVIAQIRQIYGIKPVPPATPEAPKPA